MTPKKGDVCFGVDISGEITPKLIRDCIVNCFLESHKKILKKERKDVGEDIDGSTEKLEVLEIIKNAFSEVGGDFDNPTKEDLEKVIEPLREYASHFREEGEIRRHVKIIEGLISKIDE